MCATFPCTVLYGFPHFLCYNGSTTYYIYHVHILVIPHPPNIKGICLRVDFLPPPPFHLSLLQRTPPLLSCLSFCSIFASYPCNRLLFIVSLSLYSCHRILIIVSSSSYPFHRVLVIVSLSPYPCHHVLVILPYPVLHFVSSSLLVSSLITRCNLSLLLFLLFSSFLIQSNCVPYSPRIIVIIPYPVLPYVSSFLLLPYQPFLCYFRLPLSCLLFCPPIRPVSL